jgi:hypothetical protein
VDNTDGRLGVRYNRKTPLDGSNEDRLKQAARAVLNACQRLEAEPSLNGEIRFNGQEIEIFINDRLVAPNREETRKEFDADFKNFAEALFGGDAYSLSNDINPRKLLTVFLKAQQSFTAAELLENLTER